MRTPIVLFITLSAVSQDLAPVRDHLQLSEDQLARMQTNINEFGQWESTKKQRALQVYEEIGVEATREVLVPGALGLRWAELESIRREVAERRKTLFRQNQSVLTDAQRVKLRAIEDAIKLDPVIASARFASLLPQPANGCFAPDSLAQLLSNPLIGLSCGGSSFGIVPLMPESLRRIQQSLRR